MLKKIIDELRKRLKEAAEKNLAQGLLFSGGLDSGILAYFCPQIKAITVSLSSFGEDIKYARRLAQHLEIEQYHRAIDVEEAIEAIPEVIKILKSFDPAIPNDLTVYFGLKFAKKMGIKSVMSGDGSDELFAGYSFMHKIFNLEDYIQRIAKSMSFSSNILGKFLNVKIKQPYLDKEFVDFCLKIPLAYKLKKVRGQLRGKWILRKASENVLPKDIIWQKKRPLEEGSGMTKLRQILASKIEDDEFEQGKNIYPVKFISKEHFYYYKIYRKEVGFLPPPLPGEIICPGCKTGLKKKARHCKICGWSKRL